MCICIYVTQLFVNQPNYGFSECEDGKPTERFTLSAQQVSSGADGATKFSKWQSVSCVTIYIESNQADDEVTFLNGLVIKGTPIAGFNMNDIKKSG